MLFSCITANYSLIIDFCNFTIGNLYKDNYPNVHSILEVYYAEILAFFYSNFGGKNHKYWKKKDVKIRLIECKNFKVQFN
jgi:hypothetical protein